MNDKIRIRLKAYDARLLDQSVRELVDLLSAQYEQAKRDVLR